MKKEYNFIDLFAGAGGFSEGFIQAETKNKQFNFLLANDINENCEITHIVRYKYQLGMQDNEFLCKDITDKDFLHQLKEKLNGKEVDVITGGPPCQSFSLAGRRRTFDKKDDLFISYLNVVRELKPKYFVMENVKGILTKYNGEVVERIKTEIKEILDEEKVLNLNKQLNDFIKTSRILENKESNLLYSTMNLLSMLSKNHSERGSDIRSYFTNLLSEFNNKLPLFANYHISKTDENINTVRHGLKMIQDAISWNEISFQIMRAKSRADIDNDHLVKPIDDFLKFIEPDQILNQIQNALSQINDGGHLTPFKKLIELYQFSIDEYVELIQSTIIKDKKNIHFESLTNILEDGLNLYHIEEPMVLLASDYGVPQNRERVIFLGSRRDQKHITSITKTTPNKEDKVTIFEALHDLDNIDINQIVSEYNSPLAPAKKYNLKHSNLIRFRYPHGKTTDKTQSKTYAEWSREGRLNKNRFKIKQNPFCSNYNDYQDQYSLDHLEFVHAPLHNHQTSNHAPEVQKRLSIIRELGDYREAKSKLIESEVSSKKRNYTPFKPQDQATTIMTIADDYIHYRANRAPTVREMARLQSFDDSFVFQGKRTTGGHRRKDEVPQFTLVGNAVPPLLARAIASEILDNIN